MLSPLPVSKKKKALTPGPYPLFTLKKYSPRLNLLHRRYIISTAFRWHTSWVRGITWSSNCSNVRPQPDCQRQLAADRTALFLNGWFRTLSKSATNTDIVICVFFRLFRRLVILVTLLSPLSDGHKRYDLASLFDHFHIYSASSITSIIPFLLFEYATYFPATVHTAVEGVPSENPIIEPWNVTIVLGLFYETVDLLLVWNTMFSPCDAYFMLNSSD